MEECNDIFFLPLLPFQEHPENFYDIFLPHLVSMTSKLTPFQMQLESVLNSLYQKQSSSGVLRKMCSENMHAANFIYRRTPMPEYNLLNSHFDMGIFLQICCIFSEQIFLMAPRWLLLLYSHSAK